MKKRVIFSGRPLMSDDFRPHATDPTNFNAAIGPIQTSRAACRVRYVPRDIDRPRRRIDASVFPQISGEQVPARASLMTRTLGGPSASRTSTKSCARISAIRPRRDCLP